MTTLGIIGAGMIGSTLAQKAVDAGYDVVIANSRGPETLEGLIEQLGPHARAATAQEAAEAADVAVVTIPLKNIDQVPAEPLAGKIVLDTNNYYPQRDGQIPGLDDESTTTSELLQAHLPNSKVAKAFNHIVYADIVGHAEEKGAPDRRALATASDYPEAKEFVTKLYDDFGFDTVDLGPLAEGWRIQRDTPAYLPRLTADELKAAAAEAKRYNEPAG